MMEILNKLHTLFLLYYDMLYVELQICTEVSQSPIYSPAAVKQTYQMSLRYRKYRSPHTLS